MLIIRRISVICLIGIALVSLFVFRPIATSIDTYKKTIQSIDEKKKRVTVLTVASSATSAVITLLPSDIATPIAEQLAEFSKSFLIILTVLFAEKYLITVFGLLATAFLIPAACLFSAVYLIWPQRRKIREIAIKAFVLATALLFAIPTSIWVSDTIEGIFHSSIDSLVEGALNSEEEIVAEAAEENTEDSRSFFQKIGDKISGVFESITGGVANALESAKKALARFIETIAVLIVVDCVIPIMVLLLFLLVVRYVFGLSYSLPSVINCILPKRTIHLNTAKADLTAASKYKRSGKREHQRS